MKIRKPNWAQNNPHATMLGVGLDNTDGQVRLTRGKNFTLVGGSEETHSVMQETAVKVNEALDRRGKTLDETSSEEFRDIIADAVQKIRG
ncbi:MAG: hypothetical protein ACOX0A_00880 [Thermoguttaceae bacterium]|jgi:hypothetical protein